MSSKEHKNSDIFFLSGVRCLWPEIWEPRAAKPTDRPRYSAQFQFNPQDPTDVQFINYINIGMTEIEKPAQERKP